MRPAVQQRHCWVSAVMDKAIIFFAHLEMMERRNAGNK
jgi:hypothetical protein